MLLPYGAFSRPPSQAIIQFHWIKLELNAGTPPGRNPGYSARPLGCVPWKGGIAGKTWVWAYESEAEAGSIHNLPKAVSLRPLYEEHSILSDEIFLLDLDEFTGTNSKAVTLWRGNCWKSFLVLNESIWIKRILTRGWGDRTNCQGKKLNVWKVRRSWRQKCCQRIG